MQLLQSLFGSKKFLAMLAGVIGLLTMKLFKVAVDPATVAAKVDAIASLAVPGSTTSAIEEIKKV